MGAAGPRSTDAARPPYLWTGLGFLAFFILSAFLPQARNVFPSQLPPLLVRWDPLLGADLLAPALTLGLAALLYRRLLTMKVGPMLLILVALATLLSICIAAETGRIKTYHWSRPASVNAIVVAPLTRSDQYFRNVQTVQTLGPLEYARQFPALDAPGRKILALHTTTHPPGAVIALWAIWRLMFKSPTATAYAETAIGMSTLVAAYFIASELGGEAAGRRAAVLFAACPGVLVYTTTSTDALFMAAVGWATVALVRAHKSKGWALAAGTSAFLATLMTWGALALGFIGLGLLLTYRPDHDRWDAGKRGLLLALAAFLGLIGLLRIILGVDLVAAFRATSHYQLVDPAFHRSYAYWVVGNIVAIFFSLGLANTALLIARTRQMVGKQRWCIESVFWAALVTASVSGVFRGETDHNWLFFLPLGVALAAQQAIEAAGPASAGIVQAVAVEALFYTFW